MASDVPLPEAARALGRRISERTSEIEELRRLPRDLVDALVDSGIFTACVPAELGGLEAPVAELLEAVKELGYHDGAVGWCAMVGATTGLTAGYLPDAWAVEIYGSDPRVVTGGFAAPVGRARAADGGLVVSGRWQWGSGIHHCSWIGGGCLLVDDAGQPTERDGLRAPFVFFEPEQVEILDTWHVSGLEGTGSTDYETHDAFVPEGRWVQLFLDPPRVTTALYRFPFVGLLALGVAAVALGLARRGVDELVSLATGKTPQGSSRTLAERPVVQAEVAQAEAAFRSSRALVREAVEEAWASASEDSPLTVEHRRHHRPAAAMAPRRARRHRALVPALLRARRRLGPRLAHDPSGA